MKNNNKRNTIIIDVMLITIVLMAIGYAGLATALTNKNTNNTSKASWNIGFSSITKNTTLSTSDAIEVNKPTSNGTSATFNVKLPKPGSKIVYDLVIQNTGTIDATLNSISGIDALNMSQPTAITYKIDRLDGSNGKITSDIGDLFGTNGKNYFRVTIEWPSVPGQTIPTEGVSKAGTISLDYIQKKD